MISFSRLSALPICRSSAAHPSANGTPSTPAPADPLQLQDQPATPSAVAPEGQGPPTPLEMQGFLDTERSYTNAFHKTLSLFVDDKTFSTPSLRAAVVGFLEVRCGRSSPSKFRAISDAFHFVLIPGSFRSRNRCTPPPSSGIRAPTLLSLKLSPTTKTSVSRHMLGRRSRTMSTLSRRSCNEAESSRKISFEVSP